MPVLQENIKLGDLVIIQPGCHFRDKVVNDPNGSGYLVQLKDITDDNELNLSSLTKINIESVSKKYFLNINDLLIPSRGQYSSSVFIKHKIKNTVASGYFYILKPKSSLMESEYLSWYLNSKPAQAYLAKFKRGTNILTLAKDGLEELPVPIVPIEYQKQIAKISVLSKKEAKLSERLQVLKSKFIEESILQELSYRS